MHVHGAITAPLDLAAFLMLGLLGSAAHCVGMCAPFVMLVGRRYAAPAGPHRPAAAQAWYHAGRLVTYTLLGAAAGSAGAMLTSVGALLGLQRTAAIVGGAALVLSAVASLVAFGPASTRVPAWLSRVIARLGSRVPGHPLLLGAVLGLLPCGLLYSAVMAAMTRGSAVAGAAALAAFTLGTVPALAGVSLADAVLLQRRVVMNRLSQGFVLAMGMWYLWRGLAPLTTH
jgi:sulfite exporter TauE/SafE